MRATLCKRQTLWPHRFDMNNAAALLRLPGKPSRVTLPFFPSNSLEGDYRAGVASGDFRPILICPLPCYLSFFLSLRVVVLQLFLLNTNSRVLST